MSFDRLLDTLSKCRPNNIVKGGPFDPIACEECFRLGWLDPSPFGPGFITNNAGVAELKRHGIL